jgi:hypothetical protein
MKKQKTTKIPIIILAAGGLLLIITVVILAMQNTPKPEVLLPTVGISSQGEEESYPEIQRVSLEDAKAALDAGSAVFVDVRGESSYAESHVPGALSIPLSDVENRLGELDPADWIITYCT